MRFVDTGFWFALQVGSDERSPAAQKLWQEDGEPLVTSNLVIGETWTLLRRRVHHEAAVLFLGLIDQSPRASTLRVDADVEDEAWRWLRRHDERVYSFVDATSFALMRRLRIREALAFDGDFAAAGFVEVRPQR